MAASFPITDIQALIQDVENIYADAASAFTHAKNVWDWLTGQVPVLFGGKTKAATGVTTLCPCPEDPLATCKKFVAECKAAGPGVTAKALDPTTVAALFQLILQLIQRFFPKTPAPTPPVTP